MARNRRIPINEFQTSGYMVRAFSALYPYGLSDLRSERTRELSQLSISGICCSIKMEGLHSIQDGGISH